MEYANNGELYQRIIKSGKLSEKEASVIYSQILSAIEYMSGLGITHRDLKPENMLFDSNHQIKIVDFGLGAIYSNDQLLKTACGSPCYASPEMLLSKPYKPLQSDIWSSGVVLYTMLTGCLPFEEKNVTNLFRKILTGNYAIPLGISDDARALIKSILVVDPEKRATISKIKKSKFLFQNIDSKGKYSELDENIISILSNYFNKNYISESISKNKHNPISTSYYLLLKTTSTDLPVIEIPDEYYKSTFYDELEDKSYICTQKPLSKHIRNLSSKRPSIINVSLITLNKSIEKCYRTVQSVKCSPDKPNPIFGNFNTPSKQKKHDPSMTIIKEETGRNNCIILRDSFTKLDVTKNKRKQRNNNLYSSSTVQSKTNKEILSTQGLAESSRPSLDFSISLADISGQQSIPKYIGPINISMAFTKSPDLIIKKIKRVFARNSIFINWKGTYNCECIKGSLKFNIDIMELETPKIYYCKFDLISTADEDALRTINELLVRNILY